MYSFLKIIKKEFSSFNDFSYYCLIFLFTLIMYLMVLKYYIPLTKQIVPWGDPFTYEVGYYAYLDYIRSNNFFYGLISVGKGGWYWLQRFLIFIFSPILIKEPFSFCIINYFLYGLAATIIFLVSRELNFSPRFSFLNSFLVWIYPINYHFYEYSSLPVMGLDSSFIGSLYTLIFSALLFVIKPSRLLYQIIFSVCLCMTLVARGNSITVISLCLFIPFIFYLFFLIKDNNPILRIKYLIIPLICFIITITIYYYFKLHSIIEYYSIFRGFLTDDISLAIPYIKYVPGIFFYYPNLNEIYLMNNTYYPIIIITIIIHIIFLYSIYLLLTSTNINSKLFFITGNFIFYGTLFINLVFWLNDHINIYNAQLIWAPMRVGFLVILIGIFYEKSYLFKFKYKNLLNFFVALTILFISSYLYNKNYQEELKYKIDSNPSIIRQIADYISNESDQDNKPVILWYGPYMNPRILNYYLLKDNKKQIQYFRDKYADDIWNSSATGEEFENKIIYEFDKIFNHAGIIVINEKSENYNSGPYGYYRHNYLLTNALKNIEINNFQIIGTIKSSRDDLVIMKKITNNKKDNFNITFNEQNYSINLLEEILSF